MRFFRNPEVRRLAVAALAVTCVFSAVAFAAKGRLGWLTLAACLALDALFFASTWRRYRRIETLSARLDKLLHESTQLELDDCAEGELAILQTQLEKTTQRLRQSADELQAERDRLADSIADISHQLRTPLTAARLLVDALRADGLTPDDRRARARELEALLGRVDWLVGALLKLARLDAHTASFRRERVALGDLARRAAEPLAIQLDLRDQTFEVVGDPDAAFLGDMSWSTEAVANLVKNCVEHTPPGGTITAECRRNPVYAELVIRDTGSGFDPDDLPRLFERFYRGKNAGPGSVGIGLALARRIVHEQNGTLRAENAREGGAVFTARFYTLL